MGHGLASSRADEPGKLGIAEQFGEPAAQHFGVRRDDAVQSVGQRRGAVGQRHDGHSACHGFEGGQVVPVFVFLARHVKEAALSPVEVQQILEGAGFLRFGHGRVDAGDPVGKPLAHLLLEINIEHEVSAPHHVADAQYAGLFAGVSAELFDVDAWQDDLAGDAVVVSLRLGDEDKREPLLQTFEEAGVHIDVGTLLAGRGGAEKGAAIVTDEQGGDVIPEEGCGVGLVLGNDDIKLAGLKTLAPFGLADDGHVGRDGAIVGVPLPREGGVVIGSDGEVEARLGHQPEVGLVEVECEDPWPSHD